MENTNTISAAETQGNSRRNFFTKAFMAAGAAAVTASLQAQTATTPPNDIAILNYALTLEHLEAAFYNQGLTSFAASDFAAANFVPVVGARVAGNVYSYLSTIRDHENQHVQTITAVIQSLGGTPVPACTYNFGYKTPDDFLATAMVLENTGVMAYDGAIALIQNPGLVTAGATIATVEARHASYLNLLNTAIPFPAAFDVPKTMSEILAAAGGFIVSCPTTMAVAGPKNTSTFSKSFNLDGSQSMNGGGGTLTYAWKVVAGSAALINPTSPMPTVQFDGGSGNYIFGLTVTDGAGNTSMDTVTVMYNGR